MSTCGALWDTYMAQPMTDDLSTIAKKYYERWNLPNCLGAIDGKHVEITKPRSTHTLYHNYKDFFSIVLMACCDANYKFRYVYVGANGSQSDGGVFRSAGFGYDILNGRLDVPPPVNLPGSNIELPHFFVGDAAFPLHVNIMRPYPGELTDVQDVANERMSRARITIECAFGEFYFCLIKLRKMYLHAPFHFLQGY